MEVIINLLDQTVVQKIGWTLVHFVWQAGVIAVVLGLVLRMLKKRSANLRYLIACAGLVLVLICPLVTINTIKVKNFEPTNVLPINFGKETEIAGELVIVEPVRDSEITPVLVESKVSLKQRFMEVTEAAMPYLVVGWFFGVFGLSLWHLGGWTQLKKLRRRMVKDAELTFQHKLKHLCQMFGINRGVRLLESALVQVPTVVGHLKPVILLPASALTGLSGDQIEAIIAHELAHIKRCDYLVNIFQTVIEIIGFYHPAVWWVSHKIRVERENCCDDIAVNVCNDNLCYAKALTTMEEIRANQMGLAIAASGGNLFERVKRLVAKEKTNRKKANWIVPVFAIFLMVFLMVFISCQEVRTDVAVSKWNTKIDKFDIDNADHDTVIEAFGEPEKYIWGPKELDREYLPYRFVMVYPEDFHVLVLNDRVVEVRFEGPSDYVYDNRLVVGSSIKEALNILGEPSKVLQGQENEFKEYVLYKDIDGREGHGYYARPDMNIRIWIWNDKVSAIYLTRSDYRDGDREKLRESELDEGSYIDENGKIVDKIDYPFVNDPEVLGGWKSVDFVEEIQDFDPSKKRWGGRLFLNHLVFEEGGSIGGGLLTWTKGLVLYDNDTTTASKYHIKSIGDTEYMFFQWKSGDYTYRHSKPSYYVLKRVPLESLRYEPPLGEKAILEGTSFINEEGHIVDKTDYPFVIDPDVLGRWESVGFVDEIEDFEFDKEHDDDKSFLLSMSFKNDGVVVSEFNKRTGIFKGTDSWTKGLVLDEKRHTASKYILREYGSSTYMFFEWKSGDYIYRYRKPSYYVLKKVNDGISQKQKEKIKRMKTTKEHGLLRINLYKRRFEEPVTVNIIKSPDGDRLTVQYAVIAVCEAVGVPYNWEKSARMANPERKNYIKPVRFKNRVASQAIADMLGPVGLVYGVDENGVYLYKSENKKGEKRGHSKTMERMKKVGLMLHMYVADNNGEFPDCVTDLEPYNVDRMYQWALKHVSLFSQGKPAPSGNVVAFVRPPIDKSQSLKGAAVLYEDGHVEYHDAEFLKRYDIINQIISIEGEILSVADVNEVMKIIESREDNKNQPTTIKSSPKNVISLIIDDEQKDEILRYVKTIDDANLIAAPKLLVFNGGSASMISGKSIYYDDVNSVTGEKETKELKAGTTMAVKPILRDSGENILLDLEVEHTELLGWHENIPEIESNHIASKVLVPEGKTIMMVLNRDKGENLICLVGVKTVD